MGPFEWNLKLRFIVAIALGFLVGLERESTRAEHKGVVLGGVRTYPIISMFGFACAWLFQYGITSMLPAGLLALSILTGLSYFAKIRLFQYGITSEVSAILTFMVGALALLSDVWIAMALGVITAFLLSEKAKLESYVERLDKVEFLAAVKFLLITLIILPALPNQAYTPYHLNPFRTWQIVVLVSSIGFGGYLLTKRFGHQMGLRLSGLLGGIVSSTAVSIATGRIAQADPARAGNALRASLLASCVMYIRLLVLIWLLCPAFIMSAAGPLAAMALMGILLSFTVRHEGVISGAAAVATLKNPLELKPAMLFAALFVVLSAATQIISHAYGQAGLLALAGVAGLVDVDPFILSLVQSAAPLQPMALAAVLIAVMSNTLAKGFYFTMLAAPIRRGAAVRYVLWGLLHLPLVWLAWPK